MNPSSYVIIVRGQIVYVDWEDRGVVKGIRWCLNKGKYNEGYYVMRGIREGKRVRKVYLHRLIARADGYDRVEFVDGNTLNCRKSNLLKNGKRLV